MRHYPVGPAMLIFALGSGACASPSAPTCFPSELALAFSGTVTLPTGQQAIALHGEYSDGIIASVEYEYLVRILYRGEPTSGGSAVFEVFGSALDIALIFQLGGGRASGTTLMLLGVLTQGLPPGQGPVISALAPNGFLVLFGNDSYRATSGSGTLALQRATPLTGHITLQFLDAQSRPAALDGDLTVTGVPSLPICVRHRDPWSLV